MEPIHGIHLGLVISDTQDPENRNRIQIWVPHLTNTVYQSLNQKLTDFKFKGPEDINTKDSSLINHLKTVLPWAEAAAPIFGGSSGLWNSATSQTAVNSGSTVASYNNADVTKQYPNTSNNMSLSGTKPTDNPNISAAAAAVGNAAAASVGTPYHQGVPMQCANWVNSVLASQGLQTSGSDSAASFANMGTQITNINQVQPGDVVILKSSVSNSGYHAGIATIDPNLGVLTFASKPGANSKISSETFNSGYVQNKFAYAVRLDGSRGGNYANAVNNTNSINSQSSKMVVYPDRSRALAKASNIGLPGSPVGTFSTPNAGSKVWVFFLGGDVQRPVYFAQAINPSDAAALNT